MRERFWELAGSKLGNILKAEKKEEDIDVAEVDVVSNVYAYSVVVQRRW